MRAAINRTYGPPSVVSVEQRDTPQASDTGVVVRVHASAVTAADSRIRAARFPRGFGLPARLIFGPTRPRREVLGGSFSGIVEAVGSRVSEFAPGDRVCGTSGMALGAHAELIAVPGDRLVALPANVGFDAAAGILFGGLTALHFLRGLVTVRRGDRVLINGASGAIGTNAVQLAAAAGAVVTAVTSASNADLARRLGSTHVVDYTETPVVTIGERFEVVLDTVGNISSSAGQRLLAEGGTLLLAVATLGETLSLNRRVKSGSAPERTSDVSTLIDLLATEKIESITDSTYPLHDISNAHARVDSGRKVGNVIVHPQD